MPPDDSSRWEINYLKEAAKLQYNWIALAGIVAFGLLSGSGLPLLLGAGLELMYLSVVPNNSRFQRLVRSWKDKEEKRRVDLRIATMFQEIPPEMRLRYADLDQVCRHIRENYSRLSSTSQIFARQTEDKLQGLQRAYLRLLHSAWQHREYLKTTDLRGVERELAQLQKPREPERPKLQEINRGRIEILKKRIDRFNKIRENCEVIDAQCAAVEDVLGLIRDQSVTMRDPQEVSEHLEGLVRDVEQTEETVRQVEDIFGNVPDLNGMSGEIAPLSPNIGSPVSDAPRPTRNRTQ
jgi:DNA repair exonuclease SbcCD ATPase subunit